MKDCTQKLVNKTRGETMENLEEEKQQLKERLKLYTTQNIIQLLQMSDIKDKKHRLYKAVREIEYASMICELCKAELASRGFREVM